MTDSDIWRLSATDLTTLTRRGDLSATEVVQASIDRMDAVNPDLNAVVEDLRAEALERAHCLDNARASGRPSGALHGVPVTIKVNVDQKGHATTNGVVALKDVIAPDDAPVVRNLHKAGAIVIGRTNTPEFSFRADTDNALYGRTHNPWGSHISPGGSSGGAGAAVMAGIGALAHGNDIGGSLRFPAAANGAVTVKPGLGRVPAWNPSQKVERGLLAQSMSVQGLITRTAADLHLSMPSLISADARDPFHVPMPWRGESPAGPIKVAFTKNTFGYALHPEVEKALDTARDALVDAGYAVDEVDPPDVFECGRVGYRALMGEVLTLMKSDIEAAGSQTIQEIFNVYFQEFPPIVETELVKMLAKRSHYAREWSLFMQDYPLVLSPFLPQPFFKPDRDTEGAEGVHEVLGCAVYSYAMNFLGLPAACVPAHLADLPKGPQPINVQIAAQRWREDLAVDAAAAIEARVGQMCTALWDQMKSV
ncbi:MULTISPECIES: amidase family protein [unclassified Ruegeria]|uniref:amidase family protein n=1 Tax=unclassified Ruegeria TaxID=2625375 RepID=UPI001490AC4B|nr:MULTISPECIES: amidase family protein [unclassified Ruegeria]NOD46986.1 amidase [Ruegeria sp. HKCCD5849]NOD51309.1 amidase [Ruegeria sp. HKCCD5851]NOD68128.1 amidase [Ruegeria sp. HKCCD7303]